MERKNQQHGIPETLVTSKIYIVRSKKIMLDRDLAELYEVETRVLNQAVNRNLERFLEKFMFQLTPEEFEILKSPIVTSSWGGTRKMPFAFTEYGVAMLSSVLRSKRAIQVNIQIMLVFSKIREMLDLECPALLLFGGKDVQCVASDNMPLIEEAVNDNKKTNITIQLISGVNHLFQTAGTGSEYEYIQIEETFSPGVLKLLGEWILKDIN